MWRTINAINSFVYRRDSNLTSELYFKLNLNKEKSKQIDIQISQNSSVKDVFNNFEKQIKLNAVKIDPDLEEYKFVLKDKTNKYNEFILKDDILLYNYMKEEKYELFYIPIQKRKSYTVSIALKDKNSVPHNEENFNDDYVVLDDQLIKKDSAFKYSKKHQKFIQVIIYLHRDRIEIEKKHSSQYPIAIPLSNISCIKETKDYKYKDEYSSLIITSLYNSKDKDYILSFRSVDFDNWFLVIFNQVHQYMDPFTFMKLCDDFEQHKKKRTSLIVHFATKFHNIKDLLSLNFAKKIFFEFYENNQIKELYDLMITLRDNILNKKKLVEQKNIMNKIISIIEANEELNYKHDSKNLLDILKQNLDKINDVNEYENENEINENNNEIKENKEIKFTNENVIYIYIDNLISKYFEPFFNKMNDSNLKNDFITKVMDFILKNKNSELKFFDFDSDIKELIITN